MSLILASTSVYRKQLLAKLGLSFQCINPDIDEELLKNDLLAKKHLPVQIAESLSKAKCKSVYKKLNDDSAVVVSGDQLVIFDGQILAKPLTTENAVAQLQRLNNQKHQLITAVSLFINGKVLHQNNITTLKMKKLSLSEIKNYVLIDNPIDTCGSYKIEEHGLTLFESIDGNDFSAIQGLPLLWLSNCLKENGYEFFKK
jgi:septum formation protein